ncbi:MAG: hypothetical protein F7C34_01510 [Desulfurococcales archaeon]|nr:hypothetical protein [Desulfurococcales archaeon]
MSRCKTTATIIVYVPTGIPLPWAVRMVSEVGGRVRSVNEDLRRVVASAGLKESSKIIGALVERGVPLGNISVEATAVCRVDSWRPPPGLRPLKGASRPVYIGICGERLVMVEPKKGIVLIKIGRPTRLKMPPPTLGPGDFVLNDLPKPEAVGEVVSCVLSGGGEKR